MLTYTGGFVTFAGLLILYIRNNVDLNDIWDYILFSFIVLTGALCWPITGIMFLIGYLLKVGK